MNINLVLKKEFVDELNSGEPASCSLNALQWCIKSWGGELVSLNLPDPRYFIAKNVEDDDRIINQLLATTCLEGAYVKPNECTPVGSTAILRFWPYLL